MGISLPKPDGCGRASTWSEEQMFRANCEITEGSGFGNYTFLLIC